MKSAPWKLEKGDRLETVAYELGVAPDALWNAPENANLRELRETPAGLEPGDVLNAPEVRPKREPVKTGAKTRFRRKYAPVWLRVRMWIDGEPRAGGRCALVIGNRVRQLLLDEAGAVDCPAPIRERKAQLMVLYGVAAPDVELDLRRTVTEVELEAEEKLLKIEVTVSFEKPAKPGQ